MFIEVYLVVGGNVLEKSVGIWGITVWNRGVPCKILKLTNQIFFFLLAYLWFSSFTKTGYQM